MNIEINTKYNLGNKVWIIKKNVIEKVAIAQILISQTLVLNVRYGVYHESRDEFLEYEEKELLSDSEVIEYLKSNNSINTAERKNVCKCKKCGRELITAFAVFDGAPDPEPYKDGAKEGITEDDRVSMYDLHIGFQFCPKCMEMSNIVQH